MIFLLILVSVFLLDLMLKKYMEQKLPEGEKKEICGGKIILRKLHNKGVAFGAFRDYPNLVERGTLGVLAATGVYFLYLLTKKGRNLQKTGISLVLGGGLCNWFDRFHQGYVSDYFSFSVKWKRLKNIVFNLSDLFIFLGVIMSLLGSGSKRKKPVSDRGFRSNRTSCAKN